MMQSWVLFLSLMYVVLLLGVVFLLKQRTKIGEEYLRKIIHICVSFLIFPVLLGIDNFCLRMVGPLLFILVNYLVCYTKLGRRVGINSSRTLGILLYPISFLLLVIAYSTNAILLESAISSVLIMGLSDGGAAIIGSLCGKHKYKVFHKIDKSVEGTTIFCLLTFIILLFSLPPLPSLILALILGIVENISPKGFDNLTVPLISAILMEFVLRGIIV